MPLSTYGEQKYRASELLSPVADWDRLRVERRQVPAGAHNPQTSDITEIVFILSGQSKVQRTGDGKAEVGLARQGTSWIVPGGTHETQLELDGSTECLHIFLPPPLFTQSALADFDINPEHIQLAYVGALPDITLAHLATALQSRLGCDADASDRLFADGVRTALTAHLICRYNVDRVTPPDRLPSLDARRLQRVIQLIEARLAEDIALADLAAEACLSPFHFSRLFHQAMGLSPHRYLTKRRIEKAEALLMAGEVSLANIALDVGFGSQANFIRVFRRCTGQTPGAYRKSNRN